MKRYETSSGDAVARIQLKPFVGSSVGLYLVLLDFLQKLLRRQDWNVSKYLQNQQVVISSYYSGRLACCSQFQKLVVVRVATHFKGFIDLHKLRFLQQRYQKLAPRLAANIPVKLFPLQNLSKFTSRLDRE